ncbi:MAG TPA: flagellar biosynthetic protein FliR [Symbiobacteriaceae bacterium]|nr:flagellar biosynthetic protein FliR [Symbiobacteriaceae bacterium]
MGVPFLEALLPRIDLILLMWIRVMGLFTTAPVWSNRQVPVQVRVALSFAIGLLLHGLIPQPAPAVNLVQLVPIALKELLVGMVIGFVVAMAFAAFQFAGELLDINIGFTMMNVLDPMTNTQSPLLGNFLYILALLVFFTINGHHMLFEAIMDSYRVVPVDGAVVSGALTDHLVQSAAKIFVIGLQVAIPVLAALLLTAVALGIMNRTVPQMNVFVMGLPVQMFVGIALLAVILPLYLAALRAVFGGLFDDIQLVIRLLKG